MVMIEILLAAAAFLSVIMAAAWAFVLVPGRSGWTDVIWSGAVGIAGLMAALAPTAAPWPPSPRNMLVACLVVLWSLRLAIHIADRTAGSGDDPRYVELRHKWGVRFPGRLFWFLQIQALAALLLVACLFIAAHHPAPGLRLSDILGAAVIIAAVTGETMADRQLRRFKANPVHATGICDVGLWGLTRHPNYFFEWLVWVGFAVIAIDPFGGYPWGWATLAGPALMYALLVHISGIPPLESHMLESRGAAFADYQARVNAFWPGPGRDRSPKTTRSIP